MKIQNIKPINRKALVAQFDLAFEKFSVECQLMRTKTNSFFVSYPSRSYQTPEGQTKFWNLFRWKDKETSDKANEWILAELAKLDPSLFQSETGLKSTSDYLDDNLPF